MTGIFSISVLMCKTIRAIFTQRALARILIFTVLLAQVCLFQLRINRLIRTNKARQILTDRGEIEIRFVRPADQQMEFLTGILSIDRVNHDTMYAYAE